MREEFIHYLWKFKKLSGTGLCTTEDQEIHILDYGTHNHHSGPDFFNARLRIGDQQWAGNVEMHLKASDWYLHGHDDDPAYDNVILHVVWSHDAEISRRDGVNIPVLEVAGYVPEPLISSYRKLFAMRQGQFINCGTDFNAVDDFVLNLWLEKLYIQRLEDRSKRIQRILDTTGGDWEALFFRLLARSFGTKVNADAFEQVAGSLGQSTVRKLARDAFQLEAMLMGQAGMLEKDYKDRYFKLLCEEYAFAKAKHRPPPCHTAMKFFRLRPANFPTVRLSQLAMLYKKKPHLFAEILLADNRKEIQQTLTAKASEYWDSHHIFDKQTKERPKALSKRFIDLIVINAIAPIKFAYAHYKGEDGVEDILDLMRSLPAEKNTIVKGYNGLRENTVTNALESQAVLQLNKYYCKPNKCLQCEVGVRLLNRK